MKKGSKGTFIDSWLQEDGIYEEVKSKAVKRVLRGAPIGDFWG